MRPAAPLAGVVVPVYNAAAFLPACLQSIAAQSMQDFRCYLIDDGSASTTLLKDLQNSTNKNS